MTPGSVAGGFARIVLAGVPLLGLAGCQARSNGVRQPPLCDDDGAWVISD